MTNRVALTLLCVCAAACARNEPAPDPAPPPGRPPVAAAPPDVSPPAEPAPAPEPEAGHEDDHTHTGTPPVMSAEQTDETLAAADFAFDDALAAIVDDRGLVRYDVLADPQVRVKLLAAAAAYGQVALPEDRARRLALWCNAYNANVLLAVYEAQRRGGFSSVKSVTGFFDISEFMVAGESLTLNGLENDRIRPLNDPRTHAALVCAAMSCPPLRRETYRAADLDEQLDDQCRRWVGDATKNGVSGDALAVSRIFQWYAADFDAPPYGGIAGFLRRFAAPQSPLGRLLAANANPPVTFREYDWALNQSR